MLESGQLLLGRYRVLERIGSGGMGVVYRAQHERLNRPVALKVVRSVMADRRDAVDRFRREAVALARVRSPHVAEVFDADILDDGLPFFAMEFLSGHDLSVELRRRVKLPVPEAVRYVMEACHGIACAHRAGVVHRDLKPQNLFLAEEDAVRRVKLVDFGIAKFSDSPEQGITSSDASVGTPLYMAPEQIFDPRNVSQSVDVWALGVILYECIAGYSPFLDKTALAVMRAITEEIPAPLAEVRSDVPPELSAIVARAMAKDPSTRVASASELAELLEPFALVYADPSPGDTSSQAPTRPHELALASARPLARAVPRRRSSVRERRALTPMVSLLLAVLLALAGGVSFFWPQKDEARAALPSTTSGVARTELPALPAPALRPSAEPAAMATKELAAKAEAAPTTTPSTAATTTRALATGHPQAIKRRAGVPATKESNATPSPAASKVTPTSSDANPLHL
jgi:serine/threonine protein kinase